MNKKLKIFLLVWPVVLIVVFLGYHLYERRQIDNKMDEADGFLWQKREDTFIVHANQREEGELLYIELEVMGPEGTNLFHAEEVIDRDMFGGGFVKVMQADHDEDKEIVVWSKNKKSYFLDFTGSNAIQIPFDKATPETKELALHWYQLNVVAGLKIISHVFVGRCLLCPFGQCRRGCLVGKKIKAKETIRTGPIAEP